MSPSNEPALVLLPPLAPFAIARSMSCKLAGGVRRTVRKASTLNLLAHPDTPAGFGVLAEIAAAHRAVRRSSPTIRGLRWPLTHYADQQHSRHFHPLPAK